jgi:hypothetical protein
LHKLGVKPEDDDDDDEEEEEVKEKAKNIVNRVRTLKFADENKDEDKDEDEDEDEALNVSDVCKKLRMRGSLTRSDVNALAKLVEDMGGFIHKKKEDFIDKKEDFNDKKEDLIDKKKDFIEKDEMNVDLRARLAEEEAEVMRLQAAVKEQQSVIAAALARIFPDQFNGGGGDKASGGGGGGGGSICDEHMATLEKYAAKLKEEQGGGHVG